MAATPQAGKKIYENRMGQLTQLNMRLNLGTYVTGGVAFNPALYGEGTAAHTVSIPAAGGNTYQYDYVNKLIKAYVIATGAEVGNGVDLSAVDVHAVVTQG